MDNPPKLSHASLEQLLIAVCNLKADENGREMSIMLRSVDVLQPWVIQQARDAGPENMPASIKALLDKIYGPRT